MTPTQEAAIYAAIHADPITDAYARAGNDTAVCERVNMPTITVYRRITAAQLLRWSAVRAIMQKLQSEATNGTNGKKSIAQAALTMLQSGFAVLELDPEILGMIDHLVAGAVLTADDKADLFSRAAEQISLPESLCGRMATIADIGRILAVDRPDGVIPQNNGEV